MHSKTRDTISGQPCNSNGRAKAGIPRSHRDSGHTSTATRGRSSQSRGTERPEDLSTQFLRSCHGTGGLSGTVSAPGLAGTASVLPATVLDSLDDQDREHSRSEGTSLTTLQTGSQFHVGKIRRPLKRWKKTKGFTRESWKPSSILENRNRRSSIIIEVFTSSKLFRMNRLVDAVGIEPTTCRLREKS